MPSGPRIRVNNAYGTLTAELDEFAVTFDSAELILLPDITSGHAVIVLDPKREFGPPEIVIVTGHTGLSTTATITRAAYDTQNRDHPEDTKWAHVTVDEDYVEILTSITRPPDPYLGQTIFETDSLSYRSYFGDGKWNSSPPVGTLLPYLGATPPQGYIMADGVPKNRVQYADLFAVLQTTYGNGDGETTFGIPNLNGKVPVGRDVTAAEFDLLGEIGGAKTVTLTQAQMPVHVHGVTDNQHNHGQTPHGHGNADHGHPGSSVTGDGGHDHLNVSSTSPVMVIKFNASSVGLHGNPPADNGATFDVGKGGRTSWNGHSHGVSISGSGGLLSSVNANLQAASTGITINQAGGDEAHNNLQPYIVVNYIIKY